MCITILKKNIKLIKTIDIYMCNLILGLSAAITGPCFLDLQRLVNTDIQRIAFIYTSRSLGYLVGAVLGGVVLDRVRSKMFVMTLCSFFITITLFGTPWSRNVETLLGFYVVLGLTQGAMQTGNNAILIQIWGSGPFFQALHFIYGVGSLIAPLIAAPFVEDQVNLQNSPSTTNYSLNAQFAPNRTGNFSSNTVHQEIPKVTYPFSIIGILALLVTVLFFVTCLISPHEYRGSRKEVKDNSDRSCFFMFNILVFSGLLFFVLIGIEIGFAQTLAPYAVKGKLHIPAAVASYMTSVYWTAFTFMRLASAFLSIRFSSMTLLIADICLIAVAGVLFLFFMPSEGVLWTATVIYGIGTASAYASIFGWLDEYVNITNKISAFLSISGAAGTMLIPFIIAFCMETIPEMLTYVVAADSVISTVLLFILYVIGKKGNKKPPPKEIECNVIREDAAVS